MNLNGSVLQTVPKNRPRIPTPDVTKESVEKENRFNLSLPLNQNIQPGGSVASGVALLAAQMANTPAMYHQHNSSDVPVMGTLLLSPIKEMDSNSNHNTLTTYNPATAALAQSVLPKELQNAGFPPGSTSKFLITIQLLNNFLYGYFFRLYWNDKHLNNCVSICCHLDI